MILTRGQENTLDSVCHDRNNIIVNDQSESSYCPIRLNSYDHELNSYGERLLDICRSADLKLLNGRVSGDSCLPKIIQIHSRNRLWFVNTFLLKDQCHPKCFARRGTFFVCEKSLTHEYPSRRPRMTHQGCSQRKMLLINSVFFLTIFTGADKTRCCTSKEYLSKFSYLYGSLPRAHKLRAKEFLIKRLAESSH